MPLDFFICLVFPCSSNGSFLPLSPVHPVSVHCFVFVLVWSHLMLYFICVSLVGLLPLFSSFRPNRFHLWLISCQLPIQCQVFLVSCVSAVNLSQVYFSCSWSPIGFTLVYILDYSLLDSSVNCWLFTVFHLLPHCTNVTSNRFIKEHFCSLLSASVSFFVCI